MGEWKRQGEAISFGQQLLLNRLAGTENFTVLVITGHSDNEQTEVSAIHRLKENGDLIPVGESVKDLKSLYLRWLNYCGV